MLMQIDAPIDTQPLRDALDAVSREIERIGADAAEYVHLSVFGEPSADTLHARYINTHFANGALQVAPSYLLLKFITIMRRHGTA